MSSELMPRLTNRDYTDRKRLPEDTVRAMHVAHSLHLGMADRRRPRIAWNRRKQLQESSRLDDLDARGREKLEQALGNTKSEENGARIVEIVSGDGFQELSLRGRHAVLNVLVKGSASALFLEDLGSLVDCPQLGALATPVVELAMSRFVELLDQPNARRVLQRLITTPGFLELTPREQQDFITFAIGPRLEGHARRARQPYLASAWESRRDELDDLLDSTEMADAISAEQAELLRDFLFLPDEQLFFMESMAFGDRTIIVLGDPSNVDSLSYAQIPQGSGRRRGARIQSPDSYVASGWDASDPGATTTFSFKRYEVSRDEVRRFVEWIEKTYIINEEELQRSNPLGAGLRYVNCRRFHRTAIDFAEIVSQRGGGVADEGVMLGGTTIDVGGEELHVDFAADIFGAFLSA